MARVLVVDDDRSIRELLRFALESEGYDVTVLCDGREVVEMLAQSDTPMIVLMDLMMPQMNGWQVCEALEKERGQLCRYALAVMTAAMLPSDEIPPRARALLRKPFLLEELFALVALLARELTIVPLPDTSPGGAMRAAG